MKRMLLLTVCLALLLLCGCEKPAEKDDAPEGSLPVSTSESEEDPSRVNLLPELVETVEPLPTEPTIGLPTPVEPSFEVEGYQPTGIQISEPQIAVTLLYDEAGMDESGTSYSYCVPQFLCKTPDATRINEEIAEEFGGLAEEMRDTMAQGCSVHCYNINYETFLHGDYLALLVYSEHANDCVYYRVYTIDCVTGTRVTNSQLLSDIGVHEGEFLTLAKERAVQVFDEKYAGMSADMQDSFVIEQREFSASDENINADMRMFLDEDGRLMLISAIGSLAGASSYEEIYPLIP